MGDLLIKNGEGKYWEEMKNHHPRSRLVACILLLYNVIR
jgi:hypothetical protein